MSQATARITRLRTLLLSRPAKITGALLVLYALCGFLLAPWLVRQQLPGLLDKHLGAQGSVGTVRINPFLLTFDAVDLAIAEKSGAAVFNAGRVFIDFESSSLFRWAWTFREIRIERPVVNADLDAKENLNLLRLLASGPATPAPVKPEPASTPRLLLQHFVISGGVFKFTDHTLQPEARTQIDPINFEIHDVSTLPDYRGEHQLNARLPGGGNLQWQGRLSLSPIQSNGVISLKDARLSTPWKFVHDHLTIAEPQGTYDFGVHYQLGYSGGAFSLQADNLAFGLKNVAITQRQGGGVLGKLGTFAMEGGSFNLAQRSLVFKDIRVANGTINVSLDEDGNPDWAKLLISTPATGSAPAENNSPRAPAAPAPAPWQISLPRISAGPLALTVVDNSRTKPLQLSVADAQMTLGMTATVGHEIQVSASDGTLKAGDIRVVTGDEKDSPVTLTAAELSGGAFDLQKKTFRAGLVRLTGGRTGVIRDTDGGLNLIRMFAPRKPKTAPDSGFSVTVDRAEIAGYTLALTDHSYTPPIAYDIEQLNAAVSKITIPPTKTPSPVELALRVKQGGSVRGKGSINLLQQSADVRIEATDIALTPLDTILKRETTLTLASGKAGSAGQLIVNGKSEPPALRYKGSANITDLDLKISSSAERLISWQRLQIDDIDLDTGKNRLNVAQAGLTRPYSRLIINKDRSTNLGSVMRPRPAGASPAPAPAAAEQAAPMAVSIERVRVERGELDFADLSLVLPFATNVKSLNGSVNGLSSAQDSRASLKFEGRIEEYGLARAEGTVQAFAPKKFTDIAVMFRNVEMQPLSPYSATFAGRKIASGRVSLDLQYKLNNSQLAGENKVLLEKFTLGERVESPDAVNLPLDLAIALLTDSDGKIDLAVPVSGNVDSPEFSYGHVIWQAIRTVITRIVSAPFRALGSLFGANAEELGDIVFDPGGARILPTEYEKMRRLAEGLQKRQQLKLLVQGTYHTQNDSRGLRTQTVRADLANREGLKLAPGEDPGPIGFDSAKVQRALELMLNERAGGDAAAQFATAFQKTAGREAGRVNAALALMGRGAGDRELYVAMHQKLIELQPLPPAALEDLAKARAAAITRALTNRFKLEPVRVGSKPPVALEETVKDGVPTKLSFEPIK